MSRYKSIEFYGKQRDVIYVRSICCEVEGCSNPPQYQIQFVDGYWGNVCLEHKPKLTGD